MRPKILVGSTLAAAPMSYAAATQLPPAWFGVLAVVGMVLVAYVEGVDFEQARS